MRGLPLTQGHGNSVCLSSQFSDWLCRKGGVDESCTAFFIAPPLLFFIDRCIKTGDHDRMNKASRFVMIHRTQVLPVWRVSQRPDFVPN